MRPAETGDQLRCSRRPRLNCGFESSTPADTIKSMFPPNFTDMLGEFRQAIQECSALYRDAAEQAVRECASQLGAPPDKFRQTMADLHCGLLLKIYTSVAEADLRWNQPEQLFAQ